MKKDLLERWLALKDTEKQKDHLQTTDKFPLAHNQQALYFLNQLYPDNPFYNYLDYYHFRGNLDINALIRSFELIIDRHDVFRTKFMIEEGQPVQIVELEGELEIIQHSLVDTNADENKARSVVISDSIRPFDLKSAKQLRLSIVQYEKQSFAIGVIAHHIIVDKWSMSLIRSEVARIYQQLSSGQTPSFASLSTTFGQYAQKQVEVEIDKSLLKYWLEKLEYDDEIVQLPTDYVRPSESSFQGGHFRKRLDEDLSALIKTECKELNVTPFVFLLSVFNILLYKYSGKKSINIGVPFSNKVSSDLENVIGFFDETVILRTNIGNDSLLEFIEKVKSDVYLAFEKKQIPLELLVKEINPERSGAINPLFQVMFIYHKKPVDPDFGNDISFSSDTIDIGVTKFDLSLFIGEDEDGFYTSFEYASDLFKESTVKAISEHFSNLLIQIVEKPNTAISELNLLDEEDFEKVTKSWNDTYFEVDETSTILDLISNQIRESPAGIAVADNIGQITYKELDIRAKKVTQFLIDQGVQLGEIIGLHFGRSLDMIVAILGVLRSGAAYLPLDPEYPEKRIHQMIQDARVSSIISDGSSSLNTNSAAYKFEDIIQLEIEKAFSVKIEFDDLAYIIYTSGSTGIPKGVGVTHANLLNSTLHRKQYYPEHPKSFLLFSSFSFDSSVAGIFWTLCAGGKLVISEKRLEQDVEKLGKLFKDEEITHTLLLPGLYKEILSSISDKMLKFLQCVILAGESIDNNLPESHFQKLPDTRLFNEYGPTEATVWATVEEITSGHTGAISIGKPIGNTFIYILDDDMHPVPPGIPGEIYIGGRNVTSGYLYNRAATRERFVNNPFSENEGELYKTGDLGKFMENGKIVFLGRADGQLKIRGYRIELREIEKVVARIAGVQECVVLVHEPSERNKKLICYCTIDAAYKEIDLKSKLKLELPDYMIPSYFIKLEEMPRLPNGKLDKSKLPDQPEVVQKADIELPRNELESKLVDIWKEVIEIDRIGINNNFFELGGDSIISIRIISKARSQEIEIKPNQIFRFQSIKELSQHINYKGVEDIDKSIQFTGEVALSPYQMDKLNQIEFSDTRWYTAVKISFKRATPKEHLLKVLQQILDTQGAIRLTFANQNLNWKSIYKEFSVDEYVSMIDAKDRSRELETIVEEMTSDGGPLFKLFMIEDQHESSLIAEVVLFAHRLIVDHSSWQLLIDTFTTQICSPSSGEEHKVSPPSNQFKEWIDFISSESVRNRFTEESTFWYNQMNLNELEQESSSKDRQQFSKLSLVVEAGLTDLLLNKALAAYNSKVEELVLTAFIVTIQEESDKSKICIWTQKDGRTFKNIEQDFSSTMGCFRSEFPLVFVTDHDLNKMIIHVKETLRSVPSSGIGYGYLTHSVEKIKENVPKKYHYHFNEIDRQNNDSFIESVEQLIDCNFLNERQSFELGLYCTLEHQKLICEFSVIENMLEGKSLDQFTHNFKLNLDRIIDHCSRVDKQLTPSDFPDADLTKDDLDALLGQL